MRVGVVCRGEGYARLGLVVRVCGEGRGGHLDLRGVVTPKVGCFAAARSRKGVQGTACYMHMHMCMYM